MKYKNIHQGPTEIMDAYAAWFRKIINKAEMVNLLLAQIQVMDFISELRINLAIITNRSNPADLNEVEKMIKNIENASLINKNIMAAVTNPVVTEVKKLKAQILKLKTELRESKYVPKEDRKLFQNIRKNRKPPYRGLNRKPVDKKNFKCYKYKKKNYFKSEYQSKSKDWIDYKNVQFLETKQSKAKNSNSEMEEVNLNH